MQIVGQSRPPPPLAGGTSHPRDLLPPPADGPVSRMVRSAGWSRLLPHGLRKVRTSGANRRTRVQR
eukprot:10055011-Alexandrium_andersonii.AAC.1